MEQFPNITPEAMELNKRGETKVERENAFDAKNYLNVRLDEESGEKKKELRIRLLPMDLKTGNPFLKIHQHNVKVPKEVSANGYKAYICLTKTNIDHTKYGDKCPFCEINQEAFKKAQAETDPAKKKQWTKLSLDNRPREAVIVRCIERGKESEGVKFWKFNISLKEDDPYNQIMNLYESRRKEGLVAQQNINILDLYNGYDLIITISEGGENTKGNTITITDAKFSSPLSTSEEQVKAWVYDSKKWEDVFKVKPYDYMSLISVGEIPWFDRATESWIAKSERDAAINEKKAETSRTIAEAEATYTQPAANSFIDSVNLDTNNLTDDLPF